MCWLKLRVLISLPESSLREFGKGWGEGQEAPKSGAKLCPRTRSIHPNAAGPGRPLVAILRKPFHLRPAHPQLLRGREPQASGWEGRSAPGASSPGPGEAQRAQGADRQWFSEHLNTGPRGTGGRPTRNRRPRGVGARYSRGCAWGGRRRRAPRGFLPPPAGPCKSQVIHPLPGGMSTPHLRGSRDRSGDGGSLNLASSQEALPPVWPGAAGEGGRSPGGPTLNTS